MKKTEKTFFVENLTEELKSATGAVLVDYKGLSVSAQQELQKRLKGVDARMSVVKNTLFKLASQKANLDVNLKDDQALEGPSALIITENDPIAPLQVIAKFAKEYEIPQFKIGIVEGKFQDKNTLEILSKLPSRQILYSQVVGATAAPLYGLVGTLQANMQKLIYILSQKAGA
jgi:large subunit ribosomal protein L10